MMLFLFFASGYYADAIRTANEYVYQIRASGQSISTHI